VGCSVGAGAFELERYLAAKKPSEKRILDWRPCDELTARIRARIWPCRQRKVITLTKALDKARGLLVRHHEPAAFQGDHPILGPVDHGVKGSVAGAAPHVANLVSLGHNI